MLSVRYHVAYCAIAAWAVVAYQLLAPCAPCVAALRLAIAPLAAYGAYASSTWHHVHGSKATEAVLYAHQALIACLLVAIGSITEYFQMPDEETPKPTMLLHGLSVFVVVGVLESLRQNRCDIEPASFRIVHFGPRTDLGHWSWRHMPAQVSSVIICNALLFGTLFVVDRVLYQLDSLSLRHVVPYWGWVDLQYRGRVGSAVVTHYLGGPFADVAETIYYLLCRVFIPHLAGPRGWMPKPHPLRTRRFPYLSPYIEVFDYALFWLPRTLLPRSRHHHGILGDEPGWGVSRHLLEVFVGC